MQPLAWVVIVFACASALLMIGVVLVIATMGIGYEFSIQ